MAAWVWGPVLIAASIAAADAPLTWHDVRNLTMEGQGWPQGEGFARLPAGAKGGVREPVWDLAQHSSGLSVRFVSDAVELSARWTLTSDRLALEHMPASGVSGLDLYVRDDTGWRWTGLARPQHSGANETRLVVGLPGTPQEFRLYLPLYNGVTSIEIGVNAGARVAPAPAQPAKPLVFYGTSITQGGCASRPGMSYPAILGRRLDRPIVNLGFASNGTMDMELADLMAELDAAVYVVDCLPNMSTAMVVERTAPFVRRLRVAAPGVPIVLVEGIEPRNAWLLAPLAETTAARNAALRTAYDALIADGLEALHYVSNAKLLGSSTETTVDGIHPTDWGFVHYADALEPVLRKALAKTDSPTE